MARLDATRMPLMHHQKVGPTVTPEATTRSTTTEEGEVTLRSDEDNENKIKDYFHCGCGYAKSKH